MPGFAACDLLILPFGQKEFLIDSHQNDNTCCNLHNPPAHSLGDYVKKKEEDFNNAKQNKAKLFISYNTT